MTYRLWVVASATSSLRSLPEQLGDTVSVRVFDSANDVLWEVRDDPPEALIAESDLPGMSGLDLAEIIPNFELPTRVLLWSEDPDDPMRAAAEAAGVYQFVHSQISTADLHAALQAAMSDARTAAETASAAPVEEEVEEEILDEAEPVVARPPEPPPPDEPEPEPDPLPEVPEAPSTPSKARFTPARVTLPPVSERRTPTPSTSPAPTQPPARGGLAARSAGRTVSRAPSRSTSATKAPTPPPAPEPEPASSPMPGSQRRRNTLIVSTENINSIRSTMSQLAQDLGAQSIILTDHAGMVLVEVGTFDRMQMMIVLPLLSTSFSTAGELARMLREEDATTLYIHEGVNVDLYCFNVAQQFLLVLIFNKKVASSKIGAVWLNAKRAIRELRDLFE